MLVKTENKFPELVAAHREYSRLLEDDTAELDAVSLWSVGGALVSFAEAYREQNAARTLSEPLEPQTDGMLRQITRLHGAFVMGFEESRDLVLKADEFLYSPALIQQVSEPGNALLELFATNKSLIEERTLRQNKPVSDYVHEFGWSSSRVGYSAYTIVRNGVYSLVRITIGEHISLAAGAGAVVSASVIAGDPSLDFARVAVPVIQLYSGHMLAFFNHSPEFRAYVEWALSVLDQDGN